MISGRKEGARNGWLNSQSVSGLVTRSTYYAISARLKALTEIEAVYFSLQAHD